MKSTRVLVGVMTGLVLVLGLCMVAIGPPTGALAAPPVWYAINTGTYYQVSASPLSTATASSTLDSTGVRLDINPTSGYADAGIVLYFDGSLTLGNLNTIQITGDGPYAANLWLDTSGDGHFFSFDSNGVLLGINGDIYSTVANVSSGTLVINDTSTYAGYTLAQLKAGSMSGVNADTRVAIWIGISSSAETMHLTGLFVNGDPIPLGDGGGGAHSAPVFPSIYIGIGAALGAGIVAYIVRRRLIAEKHG